MWKWCDVEHSAPCGLVSFQMGDIIHERSTPFSASAYDSYSRGGHGKRSLRCWCTHPPSLPPWPLCPCCLGQVLEHVRREDGWVVPDSHFSRVSEVVDALRRELGWHARRKLCCLDTILLEMIPLRISLSSNLAPSRQKTKQSCLSPLANSQWTSFPWVTFSPNTYPLCYSQFFPLGICLLFTLDSRSCWSVVRIILHMA